jgi:hypothetical protein
LVGMSQRLGQPPSQNTRATIDAGSGAVSRFWIVIQGTVELDLHGIIYACAEGTFYSVGVDTLFLGRSFVSVMFWDR